MAEIQDVMDKLDDVLEKIADNKEKIDEVIATQALKQDITITCTRCKGTGKILTNTSTPGNLVEADCPECTGNGWNIIGSINE